MTTRKILFEYRITCYDDREASKGDCPGKETNWPTPFIEDAPWYEVPVEETKALFDESLVIWGDHMTINFESLIEDQGERDCQDITNGDYLHLCEYEVRMISINEVTTVPQYVLDQIKGFEKQIENLERNSEKFPDKAEEYNIKIEILKEEIRKLKERYGIE